MNTSIELHFQEMLHHLYINPLERCNLRCAVCYTQKTSFVLSQKEIMDFVRRYQRVHVLETITLCGGEVFMLPFIPDLINALTHEHIFVQVITNGTIDRLSELKRPNSINCIVSIDGPRQLHDKNRGHGNFGKSMEFLKTARRLGFHTEIFSIVTRQAYPQLDEFERFIVRELGKNIPITYHPRKPLEYLQRHPISNVVGKTAGFDFLHAGEIAHLMNTRKTFPPKNLGCYQISLMSDGTIYGCCEGVRPIGTIHSSIRSITSSLKKQIRLWENTGRVKGCLGCSEPGFACGIKKYYE